MKYSSSFIVILLLVLGFTFLLVAWTSPPHTSNSTTDLPGVTVVELFTSQGCSSCPPADAVLRDIAQQSEQQNLAVYVLSFHVDYWNRLGWKDPYSHPDFTERQRAYTQTWKNTQMYTPQMTVNGNPGFVGSRKQQAWQEIKRALKQPARSAINLQVDVSGGQAIVAYQVTGDYQGKQLQIALVEKNIQTSVRRGENGGRTLYHTHVVRNFSSHPLNSSAQAKITLQLPKNLKTADASIIAYIQDSSNLKITGASAQALADL
ncbi:MAG: DUF1223 domain-containing protein [Bacteroidota bacterium]